MILTYLGSIHRRRMGCSAEENNVINAAIEMEDRSVWVA